MYFPPEWEHNVNSACDMHGMRAVSIAMVFDMYMQQYILYDGIDMH